MQKKAAILAAVAAFAAANVYADNSGSGFEVYGKAGFAGVGVGVGYGINERFTVRSDFMTVGSPSYDFDEDDIRYDVELKNNKFNLMADYFPMDNGFRITAGLGFGKTKLDGYGVARNQTTHNLKIGNQRYDIAITGNDKVYAKVEYPNVSPYLGIGWGHNIRQRPSGSWGFTFDLGVFIGSPDTHVSVSNSLNQKLVDAQAKLDGYGVALTDAQKAEIQKKVNDQIHAERKKIEDEVGKYNVIPALMVGVTYRF